MRYAMGSEAGRKNTRFNKISADQQTFSNIALSEQVSNHGLSRTLLEIHAPYQTEWYEIEISQFIKSDRNHETLIAYIWSRILPAGTRSDLMTKWIYRRVIRGLEVLLRKLYIYLVSHLAQSDNKAFYIPVSNA